MRTLSKYEKKHNDIKLSNFLVVEENNTPKVYLTDFGFMDNRKGGTPLFASPECNIGTQVEKSDIYSLGGCFISLLSDEPTFAKLILLPLMNEEQSKMASKIVSNNPIVALAKTMLNPNPSKRPSISLIIEQLESMRTEIFDINLSKDKDVLDLFLTFRCDKTSQTIQDHLKSIR